MNLPAEEGFRHHLQSIKILKDSQLLLLILLFTQQMNFWHSSYFRLCHGWHSFSCHLNDSEDKQDNIKCSIFSFKLIFTSRKNAQRLGHVITKQWSGATNIQLQVCNQIVRQVEALKLPSIEMDLAESGVIWYVFIKEQDAEDFRKFCRSHILWEAFKDSMPTCSVPGYLLRYTHKTSGTKTSCFKMSCYKMLIFKTSNHKSVVNKTAVNKMPVYKTAIYKRTVYKTSVNKISLLVNITNRPFSKKCSIAGDEGNPLLFPAPLPIPTPWKEKLIAQGFEQCCGYRSGSTGSICF